MAGLTRTSTLLNVKARRDVRHRLHDDVTVGASLAAHACDRRLPPRRRISTRQDHQPDRRQRRRRRLRRLRAPARALHAAATFRASRPSWCATCRAPAAWSMSNHIYSQAPRDGLTIGMMSRSNPIEPVLGNPAAKFKSRGIPLARHLVELRGRRLLPRHPGGLRRSRPIADVQKPEAVRCCSAGSPPAAPTPTLS